MHYTEIAVALGNKCNAECRMCCFSANNLGNKQLNLSVISDFLKTAEKVEEISTIHFTGGEAFLYYDMLLILVELCNKIGKKATVITNAFWAKDEYTSCQKLYQLKEAGLYAIGVSYDQYHAEFVPAEYIRNVIRVAKKVGLKPSIQVTIAEKSKNGYWLDELGCDLVDVIVNFIACDNVGRAQDYISEDAYIRRTKPHGCVCRKGGVFSVLFDGTVWPCCSPVVYHTDLCIGNIYNELHTVNDALEGMQKNPVLKVLRNKGFDYFLDIIKKNRLFEIPNEIISSCELCRMLFSNNQLKVLEPFLYEKLVNDNECVKYEL